MKQGWEIKKLGEVCEFSQGIQVPIEEQYNKCEDGMIRFLRIIDFTQDGEIPRYVYNVGERYILHDNETAIVRYGTPGFVCYGKYGIIANNLFKILPKQNIFHTPFLRYWLKSNAFQGVIRGAKYGVALQAIKFSTISSIPIPVPPREEQERIVAELDCLSGVIEKKREQLKQLDALAQSIFYQMFGDPITNEKGWEVKKLGEVVQSNMIGLTRSGAEQGESKQYLYFKMNNISNKGGVDFSKLTRVDASNSEIEKYSLSYGDFLFNTRNSFDLVGKSCVYNVRYGEIMVFNNNIMRIVFNQNVSTIYMAYLFQNRYISEQLDKIKKGTTSVWAIYYKDLEHILVNIPPFALQQEFADKIEAIEKQKELIKQSISKTEELFNSRMDYYFN